MGAWKLSLCKKGSDFALLGTGIGDIHVLELEELEFGPAFRGGWLLKLLLGFRVSWCL